MAFCSRCGSQLNGGEAFCPSCGERVGDAPINQPEYNNFTPQPPYNYATTPSAAAPATPAIGVLKKVASSPLFLTGAIAFTLAIVFNFIRAFTVGSFFGVIMDCLYRFAELTDSYEIYYAICEAEYYLSGISNIITWASVLPTLIGMITSILIAIGLWLTFSAGADKTTSGFLTTGLTMIKVMTVISFVFTCIGYGLAVILMLIFTIGIIASSARFTPIAVILFFVIISVFAVVAVLSILYYVKLIKTINAAKTTARGGNADPYASAYVGVWCFVAAFCNLFSIVTAFTIAGKLSVLCSVISFCCFGILIFTYRSRMRILAYTPMPLSTGETAGESDFSN